jgi:hypothetical protein
VNDFRVFASADGYVDLLKKTQAYGAAFLLFADLQAMHTSTSAHHKISFAMSILDKLANLKCQIGRSANNDQEAFKSFVSERHWQQLRTLIGGALRAMNYADLATKFEIVVDNCYRSVRSSLDMRNGNFDEEDQLLKTLLSQRNLRHGTFLMRNQFEKVFFETAGLVSDAVGVLAFVLVIGLISDPRAFLGFSSTTQVTP